MLDTEVAYASSRLSFSKTRLCEYIGAHAAMAMVGNWQSFLSSAPQRPLPAAGTLLDLVLARRVGIAVWVIPVVFTMPSNMTAASAQWTTLSW